MQYKQVSKPDGWSLIRVIEENIKKYGLSPRYIAMEE